VKRRPPLDHDAALAEVRGVYAALEQRPIERACTRLKECCHFKLTGRTPYLTKGEALVAAKALRASGRKALADRADGICPLLDDRTGNCLVYRDRPFGCRTHFCAAAGGPYARREVADLIHRLEAIDAQLGGNGASALPHALRTALAATEGRASARPHSGRDPSSNKPDAQKRVPPDTR
jgi:Fe-S-cluster containining protein